MTSEDEKFSAQPSSLPKNILIFGQAKNSLVPCCTWKWHLKVLKISKLEIVYFRSTYTLSYINYHFCNSLVYFFFFLMVGILIYNLKIT